MADGGKDVTVVAKKAVGGAASSVCELSLAVGRSTVSDLAAHIAVQEGCDASQVTLVSRGAPLKDLAAPLQPLIDSATGKVNVVYIIRKPVAQAVPAPTSTAPASAPAAASSASSAPSASEPGKQELGRRVLLLLRHGQCCHEGESDVMKELTTHGHCQAEESASFVARLIAAGKVPEQRMLLHSTSRRATETAAKLPNHLPGLEVWNADLLRETDPTSNPLRAEEVFHRLFVVPAAGASDTLIVVAHNNIILYLLMRAAGVPIERAAQAWSLFSLRHASVTRIDVTSSGALQIVSVGAAGHIPDAHMTWNNITGADMSAWKGGGPERRKFSGRMLILLRQQADDEHKGSQQIDAVAAHVKGLGEYMVSGHLTVACTVAAQPTAAGVARRYRTVPQVLPDSITEHPEAAFLRFFTPSTERGRDTVVMVAEDYPILYWLLRALHMSQDEAKAVISSYRIGHASVSLVNIRSDGSIKVVAVGDTGHLPLSCT
eukprot:TRINITY_DN34310_c0_g1_i1.p1 TRINITY_DN34310_c0_g1~~TRINITY_DN34310_c0_g1_i1.p1  ORF type:complete len:515 (+),score=90.93 TRINITY_DN34310_c0_g1_i1:77-1546(+)